MVNFNSKNIVTIFILHLFFNSMTASSQESIYLDKGISGFGLSGGFYKAEDITGYGLSVGYSINSILDLGFMLGRFSNELKEYDSNINCTAISPSLGLHLIKQDHSIPLSVYVSGEYEKDIYSGDLLDENDLSMKSTSTSIGGLIYSSIKTSANFSIIPNAGISYTNGKTEIEDSYGNSISADDNWTSFSFGIAFGIKSEPNEIFFIDPGISFDEDNNTAFHISLGLIFPTTKIDSHEKISDKKLSEQNDIESLFKDRYYQYLDIKRVVKKYLLVYINESTPMNLGDTYKIVRYKNYENRELGYNEIGIAKVLKIEENKVAMEYKLLNQSDIVTNNDKVEYK